MTPTVYRLLGPSHNRLVTVIDDPDRKLGQIDPKSADTLRLHGWRPYTGPAKAKAGWLVPETDPNLHPRKVQIS